MATTDEINRALKTVLGALGFRHAQEHPNSHAHDVVGRDGAVVLAGTADDIWVWVKRLKGLPAYEVQPGQVRVALGPYGTHSPNVLVGARAPDRNGGAMLWVYRRDGKHWRRVKAYSAKRIARQWPAVESEGHAVPSEQVYTP